MLCNKCGCSVMYDAVEVAWKMLKVAKDKGIELSNLQLQKLVYIANGYMLGWKNKNLCTQPMEAWEYGPVIGDVYHTFKSNGKGVIPVNTDIVTALDNDNDAEYIISGVLDNYGKKSAPELVNLTHQEDSPWTEVWEREAKHYRSVPIDEDLIKNHYRKLISGDTTVRGL
ncbi:DUF4065 domain-containing protein [Vibrio cholerae]|nr:DUF4065 domain-containing protein [Vibrio cholerae]EGR4155396.1 DUF4065 domain-containing protein [Vibrio cholerae]EGR4418495.1 DUF4065 domain-containing protein [Vibrio cholerae]